MPELRRSFRGVQKVKYAAVPSINYLIFEAVSRILKQRRPNSG